jgi:hypothetical protein
VTFLFTLQETLDFKKIDSFHGTGAFNATNFPSWDSLFLDLVNRPTETVVVFKSRQRHHRGWSNSNNYLDNIGNKDAKQKPLAKVNPYLEAVSTFDIYFTEHLRELLHILDV